MAEPVKFILARTIFLDDGVTIDPGTHVGTIIMEDIPGFHAPPRFLADGIVNGGMVPENAMPAASRRPVATAQTLGMPQHPGLHPDEQGDPQ